MKRLNGWTIGFDADDTLWHNERFFQLTQARFADLLRDFTDADHLSERLLAAERRNLGHYGYGVKGFVLSMIETALEVTEERVPASVIADLIAAGQEMLSHPIELLPGVEETIMSLKETVTLILVTKGDLLDQERKLAQSGLGDHFDKVEIVSEKTAPTYARIFAHGGPAAMVGNSLRSDVVPAIEAGVYGIHVPHDLTWELERAEAPIDNPRFHRIDTMSALPALLDRIS